MQTPRTFTLRIIIYEINIIHKIPTFMKKYRTSVRHIKKKNPFAPNKYLLFYARY